MGSSNVEVSRTIDADRERVWSALTDPALVSQWMMGAELDTDWQPGSAISWKGEQGGQAYEDSGKVLEVDEGACLRYTHRSGGEGPEHELTWTLDGADDGPTELALVQSGAADDDQVEQFTAGWNAMLDQLAEVAGS
jgi:uncharacterized protein YndB with AHSA1/START domain